MARTSSSRDVAAFKLRTGNSPLYRSLSGSPVKKMVYPATFGLSGASAPKLDLSRHVEEREDWKKPTEGDGLGLPVESTAPNNQLLSTLSNSLEGEVLNESAIKKKSPSKMGKGKRVFKIKRK